MAKVNAVWVDSNGNKNFINVNKDNHRVWLHNEYRIMQCLSNIMFLRNDLNGSQAKIDYIYNALNNIDNSDILVDVLRKETKLNWSKV